MKELRFIYRLSNSPYIHFLMHLIFVGEDNTMCFFKKIKCKFLVLFFAVLLSGCNDLIIKDDGQVSVGLEDCEGVTFAIVVGQSGRSDTSYPAVQVEDGVLDFDVENAGLDFDRAINITITAVGPGAQACGIAYRETLVFNGMADAVGIGDHKISLSDFNRR